MSQGEPGVIVRRRPYAGAAALLVVGLLTGCGSGAPEPVDTSPTSTQTEPSPTVFPLPNETADPEPQPPEWDPALDEPTLDNAFAFGEYFMELYSYVVATGDTSQWHRFSHPECVFCADVAAEAERSDFTPGDTDVTLVVLGGSELDPRHYFSLDYELVERLDGSSEGTDYRTDMGVLHEGGQWRMRAVEVNISGTTNG